jgi:hypothetical protein
MGTLDKDFFSQDLDFLIAETGRTFTGVSPARIEGVKYMGAVRSIEEAYDVEVYGREASVDSEIVINRDHQAEQPSKGCVLTDAGGNFYKVFETEGEDFGSVLRLRVVSKYAKE